MFRTHPDRVTRFMWRAVVPGIILLSLLASLGVVSAQGGTTHIIRAGETLGAIAQQYGVSVQAIASANGIVNPDLIYAGQTLVIPAGSGGGGDFGTGGPFVGGIYGAATTPNAYLASNATQFVGVIPRGTPFTALARSDRPGSNMMLVQGEGFVVWVAWPWTTLSETQFLSLPQADQVFLPQLLCYATFCQQTVVGGNPVGGQVQSVGAGGATSPVGGAGVVFGAPLLGAPGSGLRRVDNANLHILFNQDNIGEGWAEFRLQLCDAPDSYSGCEPVLRLYEFGQEVPPLRVENGYPVWRMTYHLHSTVRLESAHYYTEQLWVSHPYDGRSAP